MAIGLPSILLRRQTGSQGRAHVRPRRPGTTLHLRFSKYASSKRACEIRPIKVDTSVWAGQPTWHGIFVWYQSGVVTIDRYRASNSLSGSIIEKSFVYDFFLFHMLNVPRRRGFFSDYSTGEVEEQGGSEEAGHAL